MLKEKLKNIICDPIATLIQTFLPIGFMIYSIMIILLLNNALSDQRGIVKFIIFIMVYIPLHLIVIYPFISFIWCIAHLIYCLKKKKNRIYAIISLAVSTVVFLADICLLLIINFITHVGI